MRSVCVCTRVWVSEQHETPAASGYSVYFLLINMKPELRCALIWPFCNMGNREQKSIHLDFLPGAVSTVQSPEPALCPVQHGAFDKLCPVLVYVI